MREAAKIVAVMSPPSIQPTDHHFYSAEIRPELACCLFKGCYSRLSTLVINHEGIVEIQIEMQLFKCN